MTKPEVVKRSGACCKVRSGLEIMQRIAVVKLEAELGALEREENEYHAEGVRLELIVAKSLARLIHKHSTK